MATLPQSLKAALVFDQSVFVRARERSCAKRSSAGLTGLMMLLFLGSWRSTLIVLISIPLSLWFGDVLHQLGQTLNLMTWEGWPWPSHPCRRRHRDDRESAPTRGRMNKGLVQAILDGAQEIAVPPSSHAVHPASCSCRCPHSARPDRCCPLAMAVVSPC